MPVTCKSCGLAIGRATRGVHAKCFPEHRITPASTQEQYLCDLRVEGARCNRPSPGAGWCQNHAAQFQRQGDPLARIKTLTRCGYCPEDVPIEKCKRVGTDDKDVPLCRKHYTRWKTHGDALFITRREPTMEFTPENFWKLVDTRGGDVDQCWHWQGTISVHGYGVWAKTPAHRTAYVLAGNAHPVGQVVDHRCHDPKVCTDTTTCPHRSCCNPMHLKSVTTAENTSTERAIKPTRIEGECTVECCDRLARHSRRNGLERLCTGHSQRYSKYGPDFARTPLRVKRPRQS